MSRGNGVHGHTRSGAETRTPDYDRAGGRSPGARTHPRNLRNEYPTSSGIVARQIVKEHPHEGAAVRSIDRWLRGAQTGWE